MYTVIKPALIGCLHDQANIEQTSSKRLANVEKMSSRRRAISACILNIFARRLLDVCSIM